MRRRDVLQQHRRVRRLAMERQRAGVGEAEGPEVVDQALISLFVGAHSLVTGAPGLAKTLTIKTLADVLHASFRRIQFTPDLLPSDVTGLSIYNQKTQEFEFRPGPIMSQVVLADEINRATPKTQSALLESMDEHQVTVDGTTYQLPEPFLVMATQNPIEYEGTYPLPEAQLDRFLLRLGVGYPERDDEWALLQNRLEWWAAMARQ